LKKGLKVVSVLLYLSAVLSPDLSGAAKDSEKLLGDVSDGSRAASHHLIYLYPENQDGKKGSKITPDAKPLLPFSTRWTCGECHSYNTISSGWHFNAVDVNVPPGRPAQPWIYTDPTIATQIPLFYRPLPGTYKPEQVGLTSRRFTKLFGRHMPGGGAGELASKEPEQVVREYISGKLEINCMTCHNGHPGQDQGSVDGYAVQVVRENFRWAAAASTELAAVRGSAEFMPDTYDPFMPEPPENKRLVPPTITYKENIFEEDNKVFFDIVRKVPAERCYFCHSNMYLVEKETEKWSSDEDVHLAAGLTCVDCHRNGIGHNITRGYEGEPNVSTNPLVTTSSCEGCHLGEKSSAGPEAGRLGAPVPKHPGIPPVHFEKLSCTACHSGPWPAQNTYLAKTSRAHRLGTINVNKSPEALPHIIAPVFAKQRGIYRAPYYLGYPVYSVITDGKIAPHKLLWPAFWGALKNYNLTPIDLEIVKQTAGKILAKEKLPLSGDWPKLTTEHITGALKALASEKSVEGKPVYIAGGKLYFLDEETGKLNQEENNPAAQPYLWSIAHDVRPAAQSLGARGCGDCHSTDAPFFFGSVAVDTPIAAERQAVKKMVEFQDIDAFYAWAFAFTFVFRPWLKVIALGCCALIAAVLLLYALKALTSVVKVLAEKD